MLNPSQGRSWVTMQSGPIRRLSSWPVICSATNPSRALVLASQFTVNRHIPNANRPVAATTNSQSIAPKRAVSHCTWLMAQANRSEEHTSELQSLMRISYAVFCLKQKKNKKHHYNI